MNESSFDLSLPYVVTRVRAGDRAVYDALFTAYWAPLCRVAFAMTRRADEAEEAVAQVFVNIWERRTTWDVTGNLHAYLASAVRNQVRVQWRNAGRHQQLTQQYVAPGESPAMGESSQSHEVVEGDDVRLLMLEQAVNTLPDRHRRVIRMRWYEQRSYEDIAASLSISQTAARILVSRGLAMVRKALEADGGRGV